MISDRIERASLYHTAGGPASARVALALQKLASQEMEHWPTGRHALDGEAVFAIVDAYDSRPLESCFWEAHRNYIDVQYIVSGVEAMDVAPIEFAVESKPYDPGKDFAVFTVSDAHASRLVVTPGQFVIFFPTDVHRPCVAPNGIIAPVRKIVVKVRV